MQRASGAKQQQQTNKGIDIYIRTLYNLNKQQQQQQTTHTQPHHPFFLKAILLTRTECCQGVFFA